MLKIRLQRVGRKHEPTFRLVLTDHKNSSKSGRFKEILGSYDARKTSELLKTDRIKHWLSMGAAPTDTVHNLLVNHKVIDAKKKNVLPKKTYTAPVVEAPAEEPAPAADAPVESTDTAPEVTPEPVVEAQVEERAPATEATEAPVETPTE